MKNIYLNQFNFCVETKHKFWMESRIIQKINNKVTN